MSGILLAFSGGSYGSPPANTVAPAVTGTAQVRQTLSCSTGTWDGVPAPTFTYQWQSNSSNISGATSSTYQIVDAYVGTVMRCVVTATNAIGTASANSNATASVTANVPAAPTIGTATAASSSTASVTFSAPTGSLATGGSAITGYTVYSSGGQTATGSSSPITVTGLNPETNYNFYVRATNAIGQSANSGTSNTITTPASYFIALSDFGYSAAIANSARVVGSSVLTAINGAAAYGGVPGLGVNTGTGVSNYAVIGGTGNTIYPWAWQFYSPDSQVSGPSIPNDGVFDSSGNLYAYGTKYGSGAQTPIMNKTNSSGSKQYGIQFGTTEFGGFNCVQFDQQGYMMAVGGYNGAGFYARISEGGSVLISRISGTQINMSGGDSDSSGNLILCGFLRDANGYQKTWVGKYDSGGTTIWGKNYNVNGTTNAGNRSTVRCIKVIGSDIYIGGWIYDSSTNYGFMAKLSGTDGTVQWQKNYLYCSWMSVTQESDGYLYWGGASTGSTKAIIVKTDTNGNEVLNRYIGSTDPSDYNFRTLGGRAIISGSNMYILGTYNIPNYGPFYVKVPTNGSKTGTYSVGSYTVVYGANFVSGSSASSLSDGIQSITFGTSFTTASESYTTSANTAQTTTVLQI